MTLRAILFLGLVAHKLLWEVMKTEERSPDVRLPQPGSSGVRAVKLCKLMVLAFLGLQTLVLNLFPIAQRPSRLRIVGAVVYFLGLALAVSGRLSLGKNWANLEDRTILPGQAIVTRGLYRYIRHPIYAGDALLLAGLQLALNSWLVLAVSVPLAVILRQAAKEEEMLLRVFPEYANYRARTKRFVPFLV